MNESGGVDRVVGLDAVDGWIEGIWEDPASEACSWAGGDSVVQEYDDEGRVCVIYEPSCLFRPLIRFWLDPGDPFAVQLLGFGTAESMSRGRDSSNLAIPMILSVTLFYCSNLITDVSWILHFMQVDIPSLAFLN